ncbi:unnamed protein product [Ceutorhynchus assimilis]|uniref:Uncharacterized protein n=1 Tax=Ceutorhynchus assimilis TaxID=467358 RepID=A0A9N9MH53_9CUCU|nr:unnamed protein product [Ceutorhynchus assimilis]
MDPIICLQLCLLIILPATIIYTFPTDNRIYNPDEFEEIKKAAKNISSMIQSRFLFDAPCLTGYVKIGNGCIRIAHPKF